MGPLPSGDRRHAGGGVEVAGGEAGLLDGVVEEVDVVVGGGGDGHGAGGGEGGPGGGDGGDVVVEGAGMDTAVGLIRVERGGVGGTKPAGGGGFPGVGEAVDAGQLVGGDGGAQLGEQPAPADRLELGGVPDQDQTPPLRLGQFDEAGQGGGADEAGFVHDQRGPRRKPVARQA
jgi:hypothetical protein